MIRTGLSLLLVAPLVAAAPVPRETEAEKVRRLFGAVEDPDKVCTFRLDGNRLKITAAKGLRGLNPSRGLINAPRTLKPVEGDFVASVRMTQDAVADGTGKADDGYTPSGGGGLLVWVDTNTHLRLSRSQWLAADGGKARSSYNLRGVAGGSDLIQQQTMLNDPDLEPVTFRAVRTGRKVASAYSRDGKTWTNFPDVELDLPDAVKVGVYVAHNFDKPLDVTFEPLVIEQK